MDMSTTVAPKSDQLNSDDLISGPLTITITKVSGTGNADQPVAVFFDGDGGKPFKPCKSMRRVMITAWGADAGAYVGRSMRLYRDAKVAFGGMEVGGTRISHMSDLPKDRTITMALTVTKAKRAPFTVEPLKVDAPKPEAPKQEAPAATLKLLAPDGKELTAKNITTWVGWCETAIAKIEDAAAMAKWNKDMAPYYLAAEHADIRAVEHIQGVAEKRLDDLADNAFPGDLPSAEEAAA